MLKKIIISLMVASSVLIPTNSINTANATTPNNINIEFVDKPIVGIQTEQDKWKENFKGIFVNFTEHKVNIEKYSSLVTNEKIVRLKENGYKLIIVDKIEDTGNWGFNPAGLHNPTTKTITIDEEYFNYAFNHEFGHFVDCINNYVSSSYEFTAIYMAEKDSLMPTTQEPNNDNFYKKTAIEYFAQSYKIYLENPNKLKEKAIKTYNFINTIEKLY